MRSKYPILGCVFFLFVAGCQSAHVGKSMTASFGGDDADTQMSFWHELAGQSLTSNDDAMHGMLLYLDDHDANANYTDRVAALKKRGLLSQGFNEPSDLAVRRGTVAVMFAKTLKLRGGWEMSLFGPTPRLATRELQYILVFPYSSPQQTFSGSEFVGVIGALEDYQKAQKSPGPDRVRPIAPPSAANVLQSGAQIASR